MLSERQSKILNTIVDDFINTAIPVSSGRVFEVGGWNISCPTIRNEMADLTELGYLEQPHTSAGRVPTQKGYRFFVDDILKNFNERANEKNTSPKERLDDIIFFADHISVKVKSAVVFSSKNGEIKYVGLRQVFTNPEFQTRKDVIALLDEIEKFDSFNNDLFELIDNELKVFIGNENPLFSGRDYGMISKIVDDNFISAIGPMRMDYERCINLFNKLF